MKAVFLSILFSLVVTSCNKLDIEASIKESSELLKKGQFSEAEKVLNQLPEDVTNQKPRILVLKALATSGRQMKDQTLDLIDKARPLLEKSDSEALTHLGQAYMNIGEFEKAQKILEESFLIDSANIYTAVLLIEAELNRFETLRQYSLEKKHLSKAEDFPELEQSLNYLNLVAITNILSPDFDQDFVIQKLTQAYNLEKNNRAVLLSLAYVYDQIQNFPRRAVRYYQRYLDVVKLLPEDETQADRVKRRIDFLQNNN